MDLAVRFTVCVVGSAIPTVEATAIVVLALAVVSAVVVVVIAFNSSFKLLISIFQSVSSLINFKP